jgi:type II secretion system (T2SS) protein M
MTGRDRLVIMVVGVALALVVGWMAFVSPEQKKAAKAHKEVDSASSQLTAAESQLSDARGAQTRYASAYASIVNLGKAVPPGREVPSLIYQLAQASNQRHVEFSSIVSGTTSGSGSGGASSSTATSLAGFTQMPFTFVFNGSFFGLYHLFHELDRFIVRKASGELDVRGRLLTIQSVKLARASEGESSDKRGKETLMGTITATAYVLPGGQGLTAGATPGAPGAGSTSPAKPVAASTASSPTPSAVVKVGP